MSALPQPKRMKGIGRVAFMAQLADITADLDAGWPVKAVYQKWAGNLGMSYVQFTRYVDRIVRQGDRSRAPARGATPPAPPLPDPVSPIDSRGTLHAGHQPAPPTLHPRPGRAPGRPPPPPR